MMFESEMILFQPIILLALKILKHTHTQHIHDSKDP